MPIAPLPGSKPDFSLDNLSGHPEGGTLQAKHAIKAADPAFEPHNARRNVVAERSGAGYRVKSSVAPYVAPEAGQVLHAGRLLSPSLTRSSSLEFQSGETEGY